MSVTKDLLKGLLEYAGVELAQNMKDVAMALVSSGDFEAFPEETSDLFVKCPIFPKINEILLLNFYFFLLFYRFLCQLSVECSTVATLLALISKTNRAFPALVVAKVSLVLLEALAEDDVPVAKLCLRAFASLAASRAVAPAARMSQMTYPADYVNQVSMFDFGMRPGPSAWPPGTNPGRTYRFYTGEPVFTFGDGLR